MLETRLIGTSCAHDGPAAALSPGRHRLVRELSRVGPAVPLNPGRHFLLIGALVAVWSCVVYCAEKCIVRLAQLLPLSPGRQSTVLLAQLLL